jgi:hypothetical protein
VKVLNGTGTAGEASTVKTILTSIGFVTVTTGDKPPYDTTKTVVNFKPGFEKMADVIIEKLKTRFPLISKQQVESQDTDVIVVTGRK